jgi:hypothetical protein
MKRTIRGAVTALLVMLGMTYPVGSALAHAHRDIKGKIVSVTADSVTVETPRGRQFTYAISPQTATVTRQGTATTLTLGSMVRINARGNGTAMIVRVLN